MKLPDMTKFLMATSRWFVDYWYFLPLFPICFWLLIKLIRLSKSRGLRPGPHVRCGYRSSAS